MEQNVYPMRCGTGYPSPYGPMRTVRPREPRADISGAGVCPCASGQIASKQLFVPAMAYVPDLNFDELLPVEEGFCAGTIFACLNLPFTGKAVR